MHRASFYLFIIFLCACSSSQTYLAQTEFRSKITTSGLKHFELSVKPDAALNHKLLSSKKTRNPMKRQAKITDSLSKLAKLHIVDNLFCNTGFWVIETHSYNERLQLRGECNELATLEDRQLFPDSIIEW